jgi:hypothetical protein
MAMAFACASRVASRSLAAERMYRVLLCWALARINSPFPPGSPPWGDLHSNKPLILVENFRYLAPLASHSMHTSIQIFEGNETC